MTTWWTFALQIVNFLVLVWLLRRFLFRPVQQTIAERVRRSEEAAARVSAEQRATEEARAVVETERLRATAEGRRLVEEARATAGAEREQILAGARATADELIGAGRRALDEERAAALATLESHAGQLASAITTRVLGELGAPEVDETALAKLEAYLARLPADRLSELAHEPGIEVVTAHALDASTQARWLDRLAARLGGSPSIAFRADPALVAGAELHFRTFALRMSWRDALARAAQELGSRAGSR